MKFSIVTISFNQAQFLEQAIRSVIEQDVDLEYIVVDPGSTDGSREIIERYRDRIAHIVFEKDRGPADGLNKGFALATGDVLGCLNSDDFYLAGGLKRAKAAISASPGAGAWAGAGYVVDGDGRIVSLCFSTLFSALRSATGYSTIMHQATFYDRKAFWDVGGFSEQSLASWDGEIIYWMGRKGYQVARNFERIGAFRLHEASITGSGRLIDRFLQDDARLRKDFDSLGHAGLNRVLRRINSPLTRSVADPRLALRKILALRDPAVGSVAK